MNCHMEVLNEYDYDESMSEKCEICEMAHIMITFYIQHKEDKTKRKLRVGRCCIKVMEDFGLINDAILNQKQITD